MKTNSDLRETILKAAVRLRRGAIAKVKLLSALAIVSLSFMTGWASTPLAVAPGSPGGSYALNDLESVNLYNGHLNFALPLLKIGGRGGAGYVMTLPMGAHWQTFPQVNCFPDPANPEGETCFTLYYPFQGGSSAGFLPARLTLLMQERQEYAGQSLALQTLTTMHLTLPDGTEYELRDERTNGEPFTGFYNRFNLQPQRGFHRGTVFSTQDGSKIYFISDADIHDFFPHSQSPDFQLGLSPTGFLLMPDGTRYRFVNGKLTWIRDVHGNEVTFTYVTNGFTVRDSLNRMVTVELNVNDVQPFGLCHRITYSGFSTTGGGSIAEQSKGTKSTGENSTSSAPPRIIRVGLRPLAQLLRQATAQGSSAYSLSNARDLFPGLDGVNTPYNPMLTSAVWLPDGRKFGFRYNSYAEVARVELPTGGAYEYDITGGMPGGSESGVTFLPWAHRQIYRRLIQRRVYPDGTTLEGKTVYSKPDIPNQTSPQGPTEVVVLTPAGVPLSREKHYFHGNVLSSLSTNFAWATSRYAPWKEGREFKTEIYDAGPDLQTSGPLLKMVENTWEQRPVYDWFGSSLSNSAPPNDPRIAETRTTLVDTNQVTRKVFKYSDDPTYNTTTTDTFNNLTDTLEYDFGNGQPGSLLRHTHTDFLKINPANNLDYTNLTPNLHIITLPRLVTISDGNDVPVAKQEILYDEAAYPLIPNGPPIPAWVAPDTVARGNATTVRMWLNIGDRWIETHSRYDQVGNVRFAWDGNGNKTELIFGPEFAFGYQTAAKTAVPDPGGANGSNAELTSSFSYDLNSGSKTASIDANGQVISAEYIDPLDRMTRVNQPASGGWTNIAYSDIIGNLSVRTETALDAARSMQSYTYFDGLGRAVRTFTSEDGGWIGVETQYDALGRAVRTSNPYRTTTLNSAPASPEWTTVTYDSLNRVKKLKTPDNAEVSSDYTGNTVTVTDQSGRKRKSVTDALGRVRKVYEDPEGPNALNHLTSYEYDTQDNLTSVSQGGQTRTFVYDSLKRLVSATNPESCDQQGTPIPVSYQYDDNHNVLVRTDARNVSTHYRYDALNRTVRRWYNGSNSLAATTNNSPALPSGVGAAVEVNYFYDGKGITDPVLNSLGRLTKVASSVSSTLYTEFDAMGRVKSNAQVTDGQTYTMGYAYDLEGNMTSETYPSGRTILTEYDASGRIAGVKNGGTGAYYAGGLPTDATNRIQYAPHGGIGSLKLGNGLWENTIFNSRLQPTEIRLGTTLGSINRLKLGYDYGTTSNNGNVINHTVAVPAIGSTPGFTFTQNYDYDPLSRLLTAQELNGASQLWRQGFSYDQFGNRRIDLSSDQNGVRTTSNVAPAAGDNPTISTANNRYHANQGYGYDNAGNLTAAPNKSFEYDADNRQVSFDANPQTQEKDATYSYDGDGRRVKKVDAGGTAIFVYNQNGQLVAEYSTANQSNSGVSYLTSDPLGTPRVITDLNGNVKARHDYLPFGEELTLGRNNDYVIDDIRQKFTSKERDSESKLDYFLARYYSSTHGRFTSPDEFSGGPDELFVLGSGDEQKQALPYADILNPQSINKYQYAYNNPTRFIDRDGHFPVVVVIVIAVVAIEILMAPDTVNAPGPDDARNGRIYRSGDGIQQLFVNNAFGIVGGSVTRLAFSKVAGRWFFKSAETMATRDLVAVGEASILRNAARGKAFQEQVHAILGTGQNFQRLVGNGIKPPYRIPDVLDKATKALGEIKSSKYLSDSGNLKEFITFAKKEGFSFNLYVRPDTRLSKPLVQRLKDIGAKVYDVVDGRLVQRKL